MATEYLDKRKLRDLTALQKKLSLQLEKDIQILHSKNEFYDLLLHWDHENIQIKAHQCILKARTPTLLSQLLLLSSQPGDLCIDLSNYNSEKITNLIEQIYSNTDVQKLESEVVQHLKEKVVEKFYTPACTPIDCITQNLYYSLVTVDSDYSSHSTVENVDRELEEQDLLSRSFELIKKSTRRASSGHVRKIVKPRVKMSKTTDDSGTKAQQTLPVYISNNVVSSSDTSGVDVNESSTSSLTEPEIWDSTEHEDEFDFFDDKTLHVNDPIADKSPLIFNPDTLKPAPGNYFPPSDTSDQGEPTSLTSNASSNFFIDASSLLDENECLLTRKEEVSSDNRSVLHSPKVNHVIPVDNIQICPKSIELSLQNSVPQLVDFSKEHNSHGSFLSRNSPEKNKIEAQKAQSEELDRIPTREEAYQTFIINETKDFTNREPIETSKQTERPWKTSPDSTVLISSPSRSFVLNSTHSPKELPSDNVNNVNSTQCTHSPKELPSDNVKNTCNVKPIDLWNNTQVSIVDKIANTITSPIVERPSGMNGLFTNTSNIKKTEIRSPVQPSKKGFNVKSNAPDDTNNIHDISSPKADAPVNVTFQKDETLSSLKPQSNVSNDTSVISDVSSNTVRDESKSILHSKVSSVVAARNHADDIDFQTFVIRESRDTSENIIEAEDSIASLQTKEPRTFFVQLNSSDVNQTFDLVSDLGAKTSSRETLDLINETANVGNLINETANVGKLINETANVGNLIDETANVDNLIDETANVDNLINETANVDNLIHETANVDNLINETVNLGTEESAPSMPDPFETQHILDSYEKRGLNSYQTFDLIQGSVTTPTAHINLLKPECSRERKSSVEYKAVTDEPSTIPALSDAITETLQRELNETKIVAHDRTFSSDKKPLSSEKDYTQTSQRIGGVKRNVPNPTATRESQSENDKFHSIVSPNQKYQNTTNEKISTLEVRPINSTNPFLNPFIDYSEQSSLFSSDSIDVQRPQAYSTFTQSHADRTVANENTTLANTNTTLSNANVGRSVSENHDAATYNASSTSISSNPHANRINASFSSTNPFLTDIQNDVVDGVTNGDSTFVVASRQSNVLPSSEPSFVPTTDNGLSYTKDEEIHRPQSVLGDAAVLVQMQQHQTNQRGMNNDFPVQDNSASFGVQEKELDSSLNVQKMNHEHVIYRRDAQRSKDNEYYNQHSTPLSGSVDNLLEMNYTPIKREKTKTLDMDATQIKRLSCQLNDENLTKANEQLNLLLSDDSHPSIQYTESHYSDSLSIQNETYSKTLCPNKTQVAPLDLIPTRERQCADFHSPDSLNADDEIKFAHHIDEDNRSKNSSDIDCLPILSGGVSLKDMDVVPASPRRSNQSTSWIVEFTGDRMHHSMSGTPRDHPTDGKRRDTLLSKSSTSLVKHGDSFSHNSKSCGFYIDLNEPTPTAHDKMRTQSAGDSEKKIFNMFIDISNSDSSDKEKSNKSPRPLPRKKMKPLSVTDRFLARQCSNEDAAHVKSSAEESDGEHPEVIKARTLFRNVTTPPPSTQTSTTDQSMSDLTESGSGKQKQNGGFFMFIGADPSPVVKRRLSSGSGSHGNVSARTNPNRHSWNSDSSGQGVAPPPPSTATVRKHRRAVSISCKLSDLETSPSAPTQPDSKLASSWHSSSNGKKLLENSDSSVTTTSGSLNSNATYNIDTGGVNGTEEVGFKSIPEDSAVDMTNDTSSERNDTYVIESKEKCNGTIVLDTPTVVEEIDKQQENRPSVKMVKLSDMDRPPSQSSKSPLPPPSRLSRSVEGGRELVQTSKSLTRLFPHLVTGGSLSSSQEDGHTTISTVSSLQSSNNRSTLDVSTDEGEVSVGGPLVKAPSSLGTDLLRMFLEEISADVTVEVAGRRIRAHKCVLSSRCQYFAAVLSGGWVESAGNVISLQGYSYSSVHFALCHIYSGAGDMPENINVVELATLADMLCLEGLKEVISGVLKHKYCHYFHKPCNTCILGVIEVLPLAAAYGLDDIYRKSLRWIAKYFTRVWPTKAFGSMPKELIDKCLKQILVHMTSDNVLDTLLSVEKVSALLPTGVKWVEPICHSLNKLHEACAKYVAQHLSCILSSATLLTLGQDEMWDIGNMENILLDASSKLSADEACRSYVQLDLMLNQTPEPSWHESFTRSLSCLHDKVKACLVRQAAKASRSPAWQLIPPPLRRNIQESAGLIVVPGDDKRRARMMRKSGEMRKSTERESSYEPATVTSGAMRRSSGGEKTHETLVETQRRPEMRRSTGGVGSYETSMRRSTERESSYGTSGRASTGGEGSFATSRSVDVQSGRQQVRKPPVPDLIPRAKPKFSEIKSRYLDSRTSRHSEPVKSGGSTSSSSSVTNTRPGNHGNRANVGISSSESSRQSSPALSKRTMGQIKDKSTSRLSLDSKLELSPQQKKQDMKLIREKLTLNIRKPHEPSLPVTSQDLKPASQPATVGVVKKLPSVAMATRLPLRSSENRGTALTKSLSTTEATKKPDTKLTRSSRDIKSRLSFDNVRKPSETSAKIGSRLSLETKSLRSSPLDNRTRENNLRASTDRLSLDTLSSRNKRRTGSSSSTTSCSSAKVSLSTVSTPNMNKNINRSPIKMNRTALLRSSAGLSLRNSNTPTPPPARAHHGKQELEKKGVGTRSGTFCLDDSTSILKNINTPVS